MAHVITIKQQRKQPSKSILQKIQQWHKQSRGTDFKVPIFYQQELDVDLLYNLVAKNGGSKTVQHQKLWARIGAVLGPQDRKIKSSSLAFQIKRTYCTYLLDFERAVSPQTALETVPWVYSSRKRQKHTDEDSDILEEEYHFSKKSRPKREASYQNGLNDLACIGIEMVGQDIFLWDDAKRQYIPVAVVGYDPDTELHGVSYYTEELSEFVDLRFRNWKPVQERIQKQISKERRQSIEEDESLAIEQLAKLREGPISVALPWEREKLITPTTPLQPGKNSQSQQPHMLQNGVSPKTQNQTGKESLEERLCQAWQQIRILENEVAAHRMELQDMFQKTSFEEHQLERMISDYRKRFQFARYQNDRLVYNQMQLSECLEKFQKEQSS